MIRAATPKLNQTIGETGSHLSRRAGRKILPAVVEIVRVEDTGLAPGVTLLGLNAQEVKEGRPEQASDTESLNAPPIGVTVMVKEADLPRVTVILEGEELKTRSLRFVSLATYASFPPARVACSGFAVGKSLDVVVPVT